MLAWPLSGECVYVCVCISLGCNCSTRRDPPPLVWRKNATRLASPARAHYPEAVRALGCQLRLTALWLSLCFSSAHITEMFAEGGSFAENCYLFLLNRKPLFKERSLIVL